MLNSLLQNVLSQANTWDILSKLNIPGKDGAVNDALASLFEWLGTNTKSADGQNALFAALDKNHDGSILDDLQNLTAHQEEGTKINNKIFGGKLGNITKILAQKNGIEESQASWLLATLAPMVLWALGKTKKDQGLDAAGLASQIQNDDTSFGSSLLTQGLTKFLDQDGDGDLDVMDALSFFTK